MYLTNGVGSMAEPETVPVNHPQQIQGAGHRLPAWLAQLATFREPSAGKAAWQLANTLLPYGLLWFLMIRSMQLGYSCGLTLALAVVAAAFLVRLFILFHDCVHGSLFRRKGLNTFFGYFLGMLVFTPFEDWRFCHLRHHVSYANLDSRGFGDIWTMTLTEYYRASHRQRLAYRLFRTPLVLFGLGAIFSFLLRYRLPTQKSTRVEWVSVCFTNVLILGVALFAGHNIGWSTYLLIQIPIIWMAGAAGIWLFYVQHQFDGVYWARKENWDALRAALEGSSFYKLPTLLRWFSSNIGYHHVHHLGPRIPNYRLKECYDAIPALQSKPPLTLRQSLGAIRLKIWDEERQQLV
ncbi:MAG: fatty acid desaturase, partial [Kiritimatiellaeota bacterium]|nr:fatty acid desaturase [Kiritimatiellota bacterium]